MSLNNCDNTLCFLEDYSVLVCKEHRTAVVNLDTHLLQHHNVPTATRKQIVERFNHFATVIPDDIELPEEPAQPIDELGEPLDALQCKTCRFVTVNKDTMRIHCKKTTSKHGKERKAYSITLSKYRAFFAAGAAKIFYC